jgi:hypothetical protein
MVFDHRDQERIRIFNDELRLERTIRLFTTADPRSAQFAAFAEGLGTLAPKLHLVHETSAAAVPPGLFLGDAWCYQAIPISAELEPFLHLLELLDGRGVLPGRSLHGRLQEVSVPGSLQVFIAPHCPFCPQVVKQVLALPLVAPVLQVTVVDGTLFPEMAEEAGVKSAPTVILDREFRWIGQIRLEELVDTLVSRDATKLDQEALVGMLKEGNASQLAQMMLRRRQIFPAFMPLLAHAEWSVRLGAMVALEEIVDQEPSVARQAVQPLMELLAGASESIQGDVIYLLGRVGDSGSVLLLKQMLATETNDELRESLAEALAALEDKKPD